MCVSIYHKAMEIRLYYPCRPQPVLDDPLPFKIKYTYHFKSSTILVHVCDVKCRQCVDQMGTDAFPFVFLTDLSSVLFVGWFCSFGISMVE